MNHDPRDKGDKYGMISVRDQGTALVGDCHISQVIEHFHVHISANDGVTPLESFPLSETLVTPTAGSKEPAPQPSQPLLPFRVSSVSNAQEPISRGSRQSIGNRKTLRTEDALLFLVQNASRIGLPTAKIYSIIKHVVDELGLKTRVGNNLSFSGEALAFKPARGASKSLQHDPCLIKLPKGHRDLRGQQNLLREFLTFCVLFIALFFYRSASTAELVNLITKMQGSLLRIKNEKLTACMSAILAIFIFHLLQRSQTHTPLSELSGDCVLFEDVYGALLDVPLIVFEGQSILDGFLLDRFKGSNAEAFVLSGSYNITIGRRDGPNWSNHGVDCNPRLIANVRLVMAIHWRSIVQRCLECENELRILAGNWIACDFCRRSYLVRESMPAPRRRKLPNLEFSSKVPGTASSRTQTSTGLEERQSQGGQIVRNVKLGALRNVDFDVTTLHLRHRNNAVEFSDDSDVEGSENSWDDDLFEQDEIEIEVERSITASIDDRIKEMVIAMDQPMKRSTAASIDGRIEEMVIAISRGVIAKRESSRIERRKVKSEISPATGESATIRDKTGSYELLKAILISIERSMYINMSVSEFDTKLGNCRTSLATKMLRYPESPNTADLVSARSVRLYSVDGTARFSVWSVFEPELTRSLISDELTQAIGVSSLVTPGSPTDYNYLTGFVGTLNLGFNFDGGVIIPKTRCVAEFMVVPESTILGVTGPAMIIAGESLQFLTSSPLSDMKQLKELFRSQPMHWHFFPL